MYDDHEESVYGEKCPVLDAWQSALPERLGLATATALLCQQPGHVLICTWNVSSAEGLSSIAAINCNTCDTAVPVSAAVSNPCHGWSLRTA